MYFYIHVINFSAHEISIKKGWNSWKSYLRRVNPSKLRANSTLLEETYETFHFFGQMIFNFF